MRKILVICGIVAFVAVVVFAQSYYPNFAYPTGYIMQEGNQAQQQNIASMANWWGAKRGKLTSDTVPQTMTAAKWGADSLACYMVSNYSGTDILIKFLGDNNRSDTVPVVVPAGSNTNKLPKIWKIVSSSSTASTLDSLVLWFQNIKKLSNEY